MLLQKYRISRRMACGNLNRIGLRYLSTYSRNVSAIMDSRNVKLQEAATICRAYRSPKKEGSKYRNRRVRKCSRTERNSRARARNRWKSRADVVWCEFNSAYKRKLSRTWNSLTRHTKSRRENLPSSREIYEPRSIYRSTGSRTRAIIDVLNLPTWPVWSRACYRKAIWNLSQALDFRCTPPKKSTTRVYFF